MTLIIGSLIYLTIGILYAVIVSYQTRNMPTAGVHRVRAVLLWPISLVVLLLSFLVPEKYMIKIAVWEHERTLPTCFIKGTTQMLPDENGNPVFMSIHSREMCHNHAHGDYP